MPSNEDAIEKLYEIYSEFYTPTDKKHKREFAFCIPKDKRTQFVRNIFVTDIRQLSKLMLEHEGYAGCFASVYSFSEYDEAWIDRIYIDIDVGPKRFDPESETNKKMLKKGLIIVRKIVEWCKKVFGVSPAVFYTGNRGFAIYILSEPVLLQFPDIAIEQFIEKMIKKLELNKLIKELKLRPGVIDRAVSKDIRRVSRMPYTRHEKTGMFCVPIEVDWTIDRILEEAKNPSFKKIKTERSSKVTEILIVLDAKKMEKIERKFEGDIKIKETPIGINFLDLPCMRLIFSNVLAPGYRRRTIGKYVAASLKMSNIDTDHARQIIRRFVETQNNEELRKKRIEELKKIKTALEASDMDQKEKQKKLSYLDDIITRLEHEWHPLRFSEVWGWVRRGIETIERKKGESFSWCCAELCKYLDMSGLEPPCTPECPFKQWIKKYEEEQRIMILEDMLKNNNLFTRVRKYLDRAIVGEEDNKILMLISILMKQNLFIMGPTSSGKTKLTKTILRFFKRHEKDTELVESLSAMTEKSLRWFPRKYIPILFIEEMPPEMARADLKTSMGMDFKLLMSENRLVFSWTNASKRPPVTEKKEIRVDCVVWTTTFDPGSIPQDFLNRAIVISSDYSEEQTRKVIRFLLLRESKLSEEQIFDEEFKYVQECLKFLMKRRYRIVIPYAVLLEKLVNPKRPDARRHIQKIVKIIKGITLVNLADRAYLVKRPDGEEDIVLISDEDDLLAAYKIMKKTIVRMNYDLDARLEETYQKLQELYEQKIAQKSDDPGVHPTELADVAGISQTSARTFLKSLVVKGLAREEEAGRKKFYIPRNINIEEYTVDVAAVREAIEEWFKTNAGTIIKKLSLKEIIEFENQRKIRMMTEEPEEEYEEEEEEEGEENEQE